MHTLPDLLVELCKQNKINPTAYINQGAIDVNEIITSLVDNGIASEETLKDLI